MLRDAFAGSRKAESSRHLLPWRRSESVIMGNRESDVRPALSLAAQSPRTVEVFFFFFFKWFLKIIEVPNVGVGSRDTGWDSS